MTAVSANAAWRNASAFVGPMPTTPMSASCEKCAHDDLVVAASCAAAVASSAACRPRTLRAGFTRSLTIATALPVAAPMPISTRFQPPSRQELRHRPRRRSCPFAARGAAMPSSDEDPQAHVSSLALPPHAEDFQLVANSFPPAACTGSPTVACRALTTKCAITRPV
jgi:hypothetical protein